MIELKNITKRFRLYKKPSDRLKEIFLHKPYHRDFVALDNVSLSIDPATTIGIIGENGSGKSTLLKILSRVIFPDSGEVRTEGKITGLLELGTGFNPELSGQDNIYLNGAYLNLNRDQITERFQSIIDFSELGPFIAEPIKNYSSGMVMRLAFSIAIHADPQCFVIDEALSVGDVYFQRKCFNKLREFRNAGGAIVFVSHDMNAVKLLCNRAVLIKQGQIVEEGLPDTVVNIYHRYMTDKTDFCTSRHNGNTGYGNQEILIKTCYLTDNSDQKCSVLISGQPARLHLNLEAVEDVEDVSIGMLIRDKFGQDVFGINGHLLDKTFAFKAGETANVTFDIEELNIGAGQYSIAVALHTGDDHLQKCFHWIDNSCSFEVVISPEYVYSGHTCLNVSLNLQ